MRQEDHEFEAKLSYIAKTLSQNKTKALIGTF
jgi:hypothetical protein